jgi:hypothetical protein
MASVFAPQTQGGGVKRQASTHPAAPGIRETNTVVVITVQPQQCAAGLSRGLKWLADTVVNIDSLRGQ